MKIEIISNSTDAISIPFVNYNSTTIWPIIDDSPSTTVYDRKPLFIPTPSILPKIKKRSRWMEKKLRKEGRF